MQLRWGTPIKRNWGDDFNYHLITWLTKKKFIDYRTSFFSKGKVNFLCIGSISHLMGNDQSIVWGSGLMGEVKVKDKQIKIIAVRGPLTKRALEKQCIVCPEVYGDPALLVKLMYNPPKRKKYRYGIIPHVCDMNYHAITDFVRAHPDSTIIDIKNYKDWREVPRKICECECILSSSLHGLIVSDAYNIPNVWVEFEKEVGGHGFKFRDYFSSVGRTIDSPISCKGFIDNIAITKALENHQSCKINIEKLVQVCPFIEAERKCEVIKQIHENKCYS